jgi:hypothetical protein
MIAACDHESFHLDRMKFEDEIRRHRSEIARLAKENAELREKVADLVKTMVEWGMVV